MSSRKLDDLSDRFRPMAFELLARFVEAEIQVKIIETLRTQAEHEANVAAGTSWTKHSKHQDGDAIDICPVILLNSPGWSPQSPLWLEMGAIADKLGIGWGGHWISTPDLCHFEYKQPELKFIPVAEEEQPKTSWYKRMFG